MTQPELELIRREKFNLQGLSPDDLVVALAGNPNTGKSTVFNALTGLKQHTGNWPGKTVVQTHGRYCFANRSFVLVDLPGTYSLLASSRDEEVARDFLCFACPDATVVVADATCLERNLNLVLQVVEITPRVVLCLNMMDEARARGLSVDIKTLQEELGIPVVPTAARTGEGLKKLMSTVKEVATRTLVPRPRQVSYSPRVEGAVRKIMPLIAHQVNGYLKPRFLALRLLDGDTALLSWIKECLPGLSSDLKGVVDLGP